ncbi:MAG: hypothetical protein Q9171_005772 [Xanthocarpia ochracea]
MSSMSVLKALPLLLVFPISILSAPAPAPQFPAAPDTSGYIKYRVSAAELRGIKAVGPDKQGIPSEGRNNALHFSISGVNPGDQPINCSSEWFQKDAETDGTYVESINCTDPGLKVNLLEFSKPTPVTTRISLFIVYTASDQMKFDQVKWYFDTTDTNWWACDAEGALCTLKNEVTMESGIPPQPPGTQAPGTQTEEEPPTISPGDPKTPGGNHLPAGQPNGETAAQ